MEMQINIMGIYWIIIPSDTKLKEANAPTDLESPTWQGAFGNNLK